MVKFHEFHGGMDEESGKSDRRKRVGGYILGKTLGEGSFAKVRLATHVVTEEKVAIKVIDKRLVAKREYVKKNLRREAVMLQRLSHPNIVELVEVMETENSFYIVTELAEGGDFMKYLTDRHYLSEKETQRYMRQIVSACDHMHRSGVVHRDLKIENLLLDSSNNMKIIDFGLSNHYDGEHALHTQCGSPAYAAPEIFSKVPYGYTVDMWSIGINMYAMLTGRLPFLVDPPNNLAKLHSVIMQGCKPPSHLTPGCQELLRRLLDPKLDSRITMEELLVHPWLNENQMPLDPWGLKRKPHIEEVNPVAVWYMVNKMELSEVAIMDAVMNYKPNSLRGTYVVLCQRLRKGHCLPDGTVIVGNSKELHAKDFECSGARSLFTDLVAARQKLDIDEELTSLEDHAEVATDVGYVTNYQNIASASRDDGLSESPDSRMNGYCLSAQDRHMEIKPLDRPKQRSQATVITLSPHRPHRHPPRINKDIALTKPLRKASLPDLPTQTKTADSNNVNRIKDFLRTNIKPKPRVKTQREAYQGKHDKSQSLPENLDAITSYSSPFRTGNIAKEGKSKHGYRESGSRKYVVQDEIFFLGDKNRQKSSQKSSGNKVTADKVRPNNSQQTVNPIGSLSPPSSAKTGRKYGFINPADATKSKYNATKERFQLFTPRGGLTDRSSTMPELNKVLPPGKLRKHDQGNGRFENISSKLGTTPRYASDKDLAHSKYQSPFLRREAGRKLTTQPNHLVKNLVRPQRQLGIIVTPR